MIDMTRVIQINNINNFFFNNLRGNQLPAALHRKYIGVNRYINPFL